MLTTILRNGTWTLGLRIVNILCAFGSVAILGRTLSPADLGSYFVVMSVAMLISITSQFGAGNVAVKNIASALSSSRLIEAQSAARTALTGGLYGGAAVLTLVIIAAIPISIITSSGSRWGLMLITGLLGVMLGLQSTLSEILRGYHRIASAGLFSGVLLNFILFLTLFLLTLIGIRTSLNEVLALSLLALFFSLLIALWVVHRFSSVTLVNTPFTTIWRDGKSFWANSLVSLAYTHADLWIAGMVLPLEDTALYGAATRIALLLTLPSEALETGLAPLIASTYAFGDKLKLQHAIRRTTQIQTILAGVGALFILLFGEQILSIAFGDTFSSAYKTLTILALGLALRAAFGPCGYALSMTGRAHVLLKCTVLVSAVCLPLEIVATFYGGVTGLAISSAFALVCVNALAAWFAWQHLGINVTYFSRRFTS